MERGERERARERESERERASERERERARERESERESERERERARERERGAWHGMCGSVDGMAWHVWVSGGHGMERESAPRLASDMV